MRARDKTRAGMKLASSNERLTLLKKYKILRNQFVASIRKDSLTFNEERITKANDEKEMWNVVREVTNPRKNNQRVHSLPMHWQKMKSKNLLKLFQFDNLYECMLQSHLK